jgi:hypothetical protein
LVFQVVESFRCLSFRDARETFGVHNDKLSSRADSNGTALIVQSD